MTKQNIIILVIAFLLLVAGTIFAINSRDAANIDIDKNADENSNASSTTSNSSSTNPTAADSKIGSAKVITAPTSPANKTIVTAGVMVDSKIMAAFNSNLDPSQSLKLVSTGNFSSQHPLNKTTTYQTARVLARGDLNNDGLQDAVLETAYCDPNCSYNLDVVINSASGKATLVMPNNNFYAGNGLRTTIKSASISNNMINFVGMNFLDNSEWNTEAAKKAKFDGGSLVLIK